MAFITEGPKGEQVPSGVNKTNWKFIGIVVVLAIIVGAGILFWSKTQEVPTVELPELMRPEEVVKKEVGEIIEDEIREVVIIPIQGMFESRDFSADIRINLPAGVNKDTLRVAVEDLNGDGTSEVIVTALRLEPQPQLGLERNEGFIMVAKILDESGNNEIIGEISHETSFSSPIEIKNLQDLTGDGSKEIIISFGVVGANIWEEIGILRLDFLKRKIDWAKTQDSEGNVHDAIFISVWRSGYRYEFDLEDLDNDGKKEFLVFAIYVAEVPECRITVFKWNGSVFLYNQEFSQQVEAARCDDYLDEFLEWGRG